MSSTAVAAFSLKNFNNNGIPSTSDVGVGWRMDVVISWDGFRCAFPRSQPNPPTLPHFLCQIAASLRKKVDDATFTFSFTDSSLKEPKLGKGVVLAVEKPLAGVAAGWGVWEGRWLSEPVWLNLSTYSSLWSRRITSRAI